MSSLKIFVVFHKSLDQRLIFPHFTSEEILQWFIMYGVNIEKLDKVVINKSGQLDTTLDADRGVTLEYQLPIHDPKFQQLGYMETSCYMHVLLNNLSPDADLIGVTQYDMRWTNKSTKLIRKIASDKHQYSLFERFLQQCKKLIRPEYKPPYIVYAQVGGLIMNNSGQFNPMASTSTFNWPYLLQSYNEFFGSNWVMDDLRGQPLTLWQTYLMPRTLFIQLSGWLYKFIEEVSSWANKPPYETHWGVLGGYTERAEALFIALQAKSGALIVRPLMLEHDEAIPKQLYITKEHYEKNI